VYVLILSFRAKYRLPDSGWSKLPIPYPHASVVGAVVGFSVSATTPAATELIVIVTAPDCKVIYRTLVEMADCRLFSADCTALRITRLRKMTVASVED
jgi:hypothetical protein